MTSPLAVRPPRDQLRSENFPVALRALPARHRRALVAVYDVVRAIDDIGDRAEGDREALLRAFGADLAKAWTDEPPREPVARSLVPVIADVQLSHEPFEALIEANLQDQRVSEYATLDDLLGYCALSANPIGHLVLEIFGQSTVRRRELSDQVCSALQLLEHWQDVAEDRRAGRIYLPQRDMARFHVTPDDLDDPRTPTTVRGLVLYETGQASDLLEAGAPLVGELRGWARIAVAGYVAGGRSTVAALQRAGGSVLGGPPRPRRRDVLWHLVRQTRRPSR